MTKRILSVLAMLSIAAMMMLSSCTAAGVECGLIGKWEYEEKITNSGIECTNTFSYEITSDDKLILTAKFAYKIVNAEAASGSGIKDGQTHSNKSEKTIESVSNNTIKIKDGSKIEYRNLGCDSVEFKFGDKWTKLSKVY